MEAGRDTVDRRIGVEGQEGRTALGNGDLREQEINAARHPEAEDDTRPRAERREFLRRTVGRRIGFPVGHDPAAGAEQHLVTLAGGAGAEYIGENLVTEQRRVAQARKERACSFHRFPRGFNLIHLVSDCLQFRPFSPSAPDKQTNCTR